MPIIAVIELLAQVFFAVHAIRTGRDRYWIFIIILFPAVGCLIYFLVEYLPEMQQKSRIRQTRYGLVGNVSSNKMIRYWEDQVELTPSVKNKKELASAYMQAGQFDRAKSIFEEELSGAQENDPVLSEGLGVASFYAGDFHRAKETLLKLMDIRPNRKYDEYDLLLARTYEELGETDRALDEFEVLIKNFTGEEARCRYAQLLLKLGRENEAREIFKEILDNVRLSPKFYRKTQRKWVDIASQNARM